MSQYNFMDKRNRILSWICVVGSNGQVLQAIWWSFLWEAIKVWGQQLGKFTTGGNQFNKLPPLLLANTGQYRAILGNIGKQWAIQGNTGQHCSALDNTVQYCVMIGNTGEHWAIPGTTVLYCTILYNTGNTRQYWAILGNTGQYLEILGVTEKYWAINSIRCHHYHWPGQGVPHRSSQARNSLGCKIKSIIAIVHVLEASC